MKVVMVMVAAYAICVRLVLGAISIEISATSLELAH